MLSYKKVNIFFLILAILLLGLTCYFNISWWWFLAIWGIRFIVLMIGSSLIQLNFHVKAFCHNSNEKELKVAITFDDGPHPITPQILSILKKYNVKSTFFCIGKNIVKYPEIFQQIVSESHIIGNHSYSHAHFFDFYSKSKIVQELQATNDLIKKVIGKNVKFFRPPYGVTNPAISKALKITKHHVIGWNIRSMDGISQNNTLVYNRIVKRIKPGSVILLHDTSQNSVRVLEQILLFLHQNNYKVVSIEELLNLKAYEE